MPPLDDETRKKLLELTRMAGRRMLPDEDFNMYYQRAKDTALELMERDGGLTMVFLLHSVKINEPAESPDRHGYMVVGVADWPDDIDKEQAMLGVGAKFVDENPGYMLVEVCHVSEGWAVNREPGTSIDGIVPSEEPDRVEVVIVHAASIDNRTSYCYLKIERDAAGKFTGLSPIDEVIFNENDQTAGGYDKLVTNIFRGAINAGRPEKATA